MSHPEHIIDENAAQEEQENAEKEAITDWKRLTTDEAIERSSLIQDVSVADSMVKVTLADAPRYLTEKCEIHQVELRYSSGADEQMFPFGFNMAGQIVEHAPDLSDVREAEETTLTISCGIESKSGRWNSTLLHLPLTFDGEELVLDTDSTRAGVDEML